MTNTDVQTDSAVAAAGRFISLTTQFTAAAAGCAAFAIYFGSKLLEAEFKQFGAEWYVNTLSADRKISAAAPAVLILLSVVIPGLRALDERKVTVRLLFLCEVVFLAVGGLLEAFHLYGIHRYALGFLAGVSYLAAGGFALTQVTAHLRDSDKQWRGHALWLTWFALVFTIAKAPYLLGSAVGAIRLDNDFPDTSGVYLKAEPRTLWKLIDNTQDTALIYRAGPGGREFRLIKLDETVRVIPSAIRPHNPSASDASKARNSDGLRPAQQR